MESLWRQAGVLEEVPELVAWAGEVMACFDGTKPRVDTNEDYVEPGG